MDYEYARRRYQWSKRFNWISIGVCAAVGAIALYWGLQRYQDWQWLNEHFAGATGTTRWSPERINGYFTTAMLALATGGLGIVTLLIGLVFVRKALDEDKGDDIKRWSMIAGVTGILPGVVFGGLLELFIWRAHAAENFTVFGLLGSAPEPVVAVTPTYDPVAAKAEIDAKKKAEYMALFGSPQAAPMPAPDYGYGYSPAPDYTQPAAMPAQDYGYAAAPQGAEVAAAPAADTGAQYAAQPSGAPICTCGRPMEFVAEYNRYYCYTDDKYEGEA